ncbi:uroporphyrin-III C-methyltransferase [Polyrhizophydium stewartii]|uniref:precorrin-2 dehydrogenase n=1 Tax=Polyrhizophydium stewartii TaxID=2732419 RepID=A0ABR4N3D0_9FUNG|nr:hypothetical protein HK105_008278 [Polyrhizophydium stewartii]
MPLKPNPPPATPGRALEGSASLLVGLRLANKHVLVVGGGREAAGRVFYALDASASVTVVSPRSGLHPAVARRIADGQVAYFDRKFLPEDLERPFLGAGEHTRRGETSDFAALADADDDMPVNVVLSCIDDRGVSADIAARCRRLRIPVNCADIPDCCDFYFMAQYRSGGLQLGVSTNGGGPRLGARLRNAVLAALPDATPAAVDGVAAMRAAVRQRDEADGLGAELLGRRMAWLSALCDQWAVDEMAQLRDHRGLVDAVVHAYACGHDVPAFEDALALARGPPLAASPVPRDQRLAAQQSQKQPAASGGRTPLLSGDEAAASRAAAAAVLARPAAAKDTAAAPSTLVGSLGYIARRDVSKRIARAEQALVRVPVLGPVLLLTIAYWFNVAAAVVGALVVPWHAARHAQVSAPAEPSQELQDAALQQPAQTAPPMRPLSIPRTVFDTATNTATVITEEPVDGSVSQPAAPQRQSLVRAALRLPRAVLLHLSLRLVGLAGGAVGIASPLLPRVLSSWLRTMQAHVLTLLGDEAGATRAKAASMGKLYLVGAGPGDKKLLTLAAVEILRSADLVISDQLIPQSVRDLVPRRRLHVNALKADGASDKSQAKSNLSCLAALQAGKTVVRLKTGDPFLFGRGGEEVQFFRDYGIEPMVVPGISSVLGGPTAAMIPVTHRGVADSVLIVSGRGEGGAFPKIPPFDPRRTTIVLMVVKRLREVVDLMVHESGYPADTHCAILEKACWSEGERVVFGRLSSIADAVEQAKVENPAMWVVGSAVAVLNMKRIRALGEVAAAAAATGSRESAAADWAVRTA